MKRILIVDDDAQLRSMMRQALERSGYAVSEAASGQSALSMLKVQSFHLVVIDMMLPGKDGLEVLREIKQAAPSLRAVAISGGLKGDISWLTPLADHLGVQNFLQKPFHIADFVAVIDRSLQSA